MTVKTFLQTGFHDVRDLITSVVKDLTGLGTAEGDGSPSGTTFMRVIYPEGFDVNTDLKTQDSVLLILESTTAIDPFADDEGTGSTEFDPWRIAFHANKWQSAPLWKISETKDPTQYTGVRLNDPMDLVASLAVYVGTPSTLGVDPATSLPKIGWVYSKVQRPPTYSNGYYAPYAPAYKGRDLVEPIGNTGAKWTNTFDITPWNDKRDTGYTASAVVSSLTDMKANPITEDSPNTWDGPDVNSADQLFVNRYITKAKSANFAGFDVDSDWYYTLTYRMVLTDHGFFLGVWGPDPEENGEGFSWILVQRPVDKRTGVVRGVNPLNGLPYTQNDENLPESGIGNRPLFCVNSVNGKFWKFVVREHDLAIPSARKDATQNSEDSGAVINPYQQQSLTENGEYVITFLNNLNSSRFKYGDELDMVGTVSSDVVGGGNEIDVTVYNEADTRTYHGLWSSGSYGTKMRIMVVKNIRASNTPTPGP